MAKNWKKKRNYKKKNYKKKSAVQKQIDKNLDFKYLLTAVSAQTVSTSIGSTLLTSIAQGDTSSNRTGNNIDVRSIQIQGYVTYADTTNILRIFLVQEMQYNVISTLSSMFLNPSDVTGIRDAEYMKMFKVHKEWKFYLTSQNKPQANITYYKRCDIKLKYNGSAGSNGIINRLWLVYISDSGTVTHPTINATVKVSFTDP